MGVIHVGKEACYVLWYNVAFACETPQGIDIECELAWCETRDKSPEAAKMVKNEKKPCE